MEFVKQASWYQTIPAFGRAAEMEISIDDGNAFLAQFNQASEADFFAYVAAVEAAGFSGGEDYTLDQNRYALRYGKEATVYLSYSAPAGELRIYAEQAGHAVYPPKACVGGESAYRLTLWQLPVDNFNTKQNGGMSYVYLLEDGSFLVYDGGYPTETEADNLYRFLKSKTPAGQKTVIRAWFFSHNHGDHEGAMVRFAPKYASEIEVQGFYYHLTMPEDVAAGAAHWPNAVHYARLHTGMELNFPGLKIQILYTKEDVYPKTDLNENDRSMVFTATAAGQKLFFLGDVMHEGSDWMLAHLSPETLQHELVQFSHHGYEGGTIELYDAIAAHTVLWPMNIDGYQENYKQVPQNVFKIWMNNDKNGCFGRRFPNKTVIEDPRVKKFLVGGEGIFELQFPYTPTGDRLPDYDKIFEERTKHLLSN